MSQLSVNFFNASSIIAYLRGAVITGAVVCVAALAALWLVERPAQAVLAEAETTAMPSDGSTPSLPVPSPTPSASSTPSPTVNPSPTPGDTPSVATPVPEHGVPPHVVQPGETLTIIAAQYDTSAQELAVLNGMADPDLLYVGQRIELPATTRVEENTKLQPSPTTHPADATPHPDLGTPDEMLKGRWIDVDLSEQRLTAYEASSPVRTMLVSTGLPQTPTPVGQFRIWIKLRYDDMAGADYYIEDVPFVMYFHEGYGLHGVTWHGNFGHPMSHGCVNLLTEEAEWLYGWANVGTLVNVHE